MFPSIEFTGSESRLAVRERAHGEMGRKNITEKMKKEEEEEEKNREGGHLIKQRNLSTVHFSPFGTIFFKDPGFLFVPINMIVPLLL